MVQPKGNKPRSLTLPTLAIGIVLGAIIGFSVSLTVVQETSEPMQSLVEAQCCHKLSHNELLSASSSSKMETTDDDSSGWKMIHVFYGDRNHLVEIPPFSQAKQDEIVVGLLGNKRSGYFVDLAAHQATYISNTYILERDWDWNGRGYF